jgi:hypothetical protein
MKKTTELSIAFLLGGIIFAPFAAHAGGAWYRQSISLQWKENVARLSGSTFISRFDNVGSTVTTEIRSLRSTCSVTTNRGAQYHVRFSDATEQGYYELDLTEKEPVASWIEFRRFDD